MSEKEPKIRTYSQEEIEIATKELVGLGISPIPENIDTYISLKETRQRPNGYDEFYNNKDNPEILKQLMETKNIQKLIHVEGPNVRSHTRLGLEILDKEGGPIQEQKLLKHIIFHHDLGKHEVVEDKNNTTQTIKTISSGKLFQTMIGHATAALEKTQEKLRKNGLNEKETEICIKTIENHMNTDILQRKNPEKIIGFFEMLGNSEKEIKEHIYYLTRMLHIDHLATENIALIEGQIDYSIYNRKSEFTFENVRNKYITAKNELILLKKKEEQMKEKMDDSDRYLSKIAELLIPDNEENKAFRNNPDDPAEHQPLRHQFGIITHSKKTLEHFFKRDNRLKPIKQNIDTKLSETIEGKTKEELMEISIILHDIGKFLRTIEYKDGQKIISHENHESIGQEILLTHPDIQKMIAEKYTLNSKQLEYVANCVGLHYELGKIRHKMKTEKRDYNLAYVDSEEFAQECKHIQKDNPEYADEIGIFYLIDSVAKTDITIFEKTDAELAERQKLGEELLEKHKLNKVLIRTVMQKAINIQAAKKYLNILYNKEK